MATPLVSSEEMADLNRLLSEKVAEINSQSWWHAYEAFCISDTYTSYDLYLAHSGFSFFGNKHEEEIRTFVGSTLGKMYHERMEKEKQEQQ